jgi:hypothetical protein
VIPADDVHPVTGVNEGDRAHQRGKLVGVIVLGRVGPGFVGGAITAIRALADPGRLAQVVPSWAA